MSDTLQEKINERFKMRRRKAINSSKTHPLKIGKAVNRDQSTIDANSFMYKSNHLWMYND